MLSLIVRNIRLKLRAGTSVVVDYVSPLLGDGIEESQSDAYEVPTEGNEEALGHVGELSLAERSVVFGEARTEHDGIPLNTGVITVLASDERSTRMGFQVDGFAELIDGVRLPAAVSGNTIDLLAELNAGISFETRPGVEDGGNCQFPMFLAPNLHGDERPKWNPKPSAWSASSSYSENDLVEFTTYSPVERTAVYQCVTGGAGTGESPATHPAKWRRTSFALANAWDRTSGQHYLNTLGSDFYSLVPWFYLKWVIRKALAAVGFTPIGDLMDDPRLDRLVLPNVTSIDAARPAAGLNYFRASQTSETPYVPNTLHLVRAQDDSTAPNQDTNSVWDTTNHRWTCPAAGTFTLRFAVTMNRYGATPSGPNWLRYTQAYLVDAAGAIVQGLELPTVLPWDLSRTATFTLVMGAGDVGSTYRCVMLQMAKRPVLQPGGAIFSYVTVWPQVPSDVYTAATVDGWQNGAAPGVAVPDQYVQPERHVPDQELGAFLLAIGDALNVEWRPDMAARTLRASYKERVLQQLEQHTTYHDHRVIGSVEQNFDRSTTGLRLSWDLEQADEVPENPTEYYTDQDLSAPLALGQWALLRSTREILKSAFRTDVGYFHWQVVGYYVPSVTVGDADSATDLVPACKPVHMTQVMLDGKHYLVPVLEDNGTSAYYHNQGDRSTIWLCAYAPMASSDATVTDVPGARSWALGWTGDDVVDCNLLLDAPNNEAPGIYQRQWQSWMAMLTTAQAVTMDLLLDLPFLIGRSWHRVLHMLGQRYLVERMPVELHTDRRDLVSRGAYLLRLKGFSPQPLRTEFLCFGPGYGSFTALAGTMLTVSSTSGYVTIRRAETGDLLTVASGTDVEVPADGGYCMWASDAEGEPLGDLLDVTDSFGATLGSIDLRGYAAMTTVYLDSELSELLLPVGGALDVVQAIGVGNSFTTLYLGIQPALSSLTLAYIGTSLDLSSCPALRTLQVDGGTLESVTPPAGTPLRSVIISDAALDEASVEAILLACDDTHLSGTLVLDGGTSAAVPINTATNDKLAALSTNLWTILVNP